MKYVVDTSVAVKWFAPEELSDVADQLLAGDHELVAPDFMLVEAANTFWKKARRDQMTDDDAHESLLILATGAVDFRPALPLIPRALELANDSGHPVYGCLFLAAAEAWQAVLVTADQRLAISALEADVKAEITTLDQLSP